MQKNLHKKDYSRVGTVIHLTFAKNCNFKSLTVKLFLCIDTCFFSSPLFSLCVRLPAH